MILLFSQILHTVHKQKEGKEKNFRTGYNSVNF